MPLYQGVPPDHMEVIHEVLISHGAHYAMSVSTAGAVAEANILVAHLLESFPLVTSVCDVGCCGGHHVLAFLRRGIVAIGLDAHPDSPPCLGMPILLRDAAGHLDVTPKVDLAMALDMPEHVPAAKADQLVANLCSMAPMVYFSAGLPGYEGAQGHVNCQPVAYWEQKFAEHGYVPLPDEDIWRTWRMELKAKIEAVPPHESYCWWSWTDQARLYQRKDRILFPLQGEDE